MREGCRIKKGKRRKKPSQKRFVFPKGWGGRRGGAGRKSADGRSRVPHARRVELERESPLHVTVRLEHGVPPLRRGPEHEVLRQAFARCKRRGRIRLVHYTVLSNHLHLIVEAQRREDVARGMNGLLTSIAKRLNALWARKGRVFDGRYHDRVVRSPREMRNVLAYVLTNARRHGCGLTMANGRAAPDPFSSSRFFSGWSDSPDGSPWPVWLESAGTWLLRTGWARAGPLRLSG